MPCADSVLPNTERKTRTDEPEGFYFALFELHEGGDVQEAEAVSTEAGRGNQTRGFVLKKVLALDLATRTGWAIRSFDGSFASGVTPFLQTTNPGDRWDRFSMWLDAWGDGHPDMIVYERPLLHHVSGASSELAFGFSTRVQEFGARRKIKTIPIHNMTLKKWATGDGRADKKKMILFARAWKLDVQDDNEADALHLLHYALKVILKKREVTE